MSFRYASASSSDDSGLGVVRLDHAQPAFAVRVLVEPSAGASPSSVLTSTTVPPTGAYTSETDFVDSTSPNARPPDRRPRVRSCTNTTSPRASWA